MGFIDKGRYYVSQYQIEGYQPLELNYKLCSTTKNLTAADWFKNYDAVFHESTSGLIVSVANPKNYLSWIYTFLREVLG